MTKSKGDIRRTVMLVNLGCSLLNFFTISLVTNVTWTIFWIGVSAGITLWCLVENLTEED